MKAHRRLADSCFEIETSAAILARTRAWLGEDGWSDEGQEAAVRIAIVEAGRGTYSCDGPLGKIEEQGLDSLLADLEVRCVHHALAHCSSPAALHAATIARDQRGLLLVGEHMSGKTTLSLALARKGCSVMGDDVALLDDRGGAAAVPRPLRVRPASWRLVSEELQKRSIFDTADEVLRVDLEHLCSERPSRIDVDDKSLGADGFEFRRPLTGPG